MRRQSKDAGKFTSECSYCGTGVADNAMRCPNCKKWFSSGKKVITASLAVIIVLASVSAFAYTSLFDSGHEAYDGMDDIPDGTGGDTGGDTTTKTYLTIGTSLGQIKVELDTANAPATSAHIVSLVNSGYYSGSGMFYRAEPGFVIQGGTQSGSSQTVAWENTGLKNDKYTISMARSGDPDSQSDSGTGSSEFFINLNNNANLDSYAFPYVVFGKVISGTSIVDQIAGMPTTSQGGIKILNDPVEFTGVTISSA